MILTDIYCLFFAGSIAAQDAIAAFDELNVEIARLRDVIDTPHMGLIRLQWWKDEIKKIYANEKFAPHDVLKKLSLAIKTFHIPHDIINQLIAAREADFDDYDQFDIYTYAQQIHAPLLQIKAIILHEKENTDALSEGYALIGLLRAIPFYKARSQVVIPDIQPEAVKVICDRALELLDENKSKHRYFKAHDVLARLYLKQIQSIGYRPEALGPLPFKELRIWWGSLF